MCRGLPTCDARDVGRSHQLLQQVSPHLYTTYRQLLACIAFTTTTCNGCHSGITELIPCTASFIMQSEPNVWAALLAAPNPDTAQLVCNGCRVLLSYPRGAQSVQCSLCHIVTQVSCTSHQLEHPELWPCLRLILDAQ
jgi:LSD1 subclass zinc finger protein